MTPSAGQNPRAASRICAESHLASGTPRMFTHCPTPFAGGHEHRHEPVCPSLASSFADASPDPVARANIAACAARASSIAFWRDAADTDDGAPVRATR